MNDTDSEPRRVTRHGRQNGSSNAGTANASSARSVTAGRVRAIRAGRLDRAQRDEHKFQRGTHSRQRLCACLDGPQDRGTTAKGTATCPQAKRDKGEVNKSGSSSESW